MRSERVRRAAARAAVTASRKTGRPVHPDVAALAACPVCDYTDNGWCACECHDTALARLQAKTGQQALGRGVDA